MRGTKHCKYCHEAGHNVRTCPTVKNNAGTDYRADGILRRLDTYKTARAAIGGVRCSKCHLPGHNIATCPEQRREDQATIANAVKFRKGFKDWCNQFGFGIGSLIQNTYNQVGMVVGLNVASVHHRATFHNPIQVRWADKHSRTSWVSFPQEFLQDQYRTIDYTIVSPAGNFDTFFSDTYDKCFDLTPEKIRA
jgi:hypothetical protein